MFSHKKSFLEAVAGNLIFNNQSTKYTYLDFTRSHLQGLRQRFLRKYGVAHNVFKILAKVLFYLVKLGDF